MKNILSALQNTTHPKGNTYPGEQSAVLTRLPAPKNETPLIVSCPHAGIIIPQNVLPNLKITPQETLARGDRYTDWLTVNAPNSEIGAKHIISTIAPSIVNVARARTSLNPENIRGDLTTLKAIVDQYTQNGAGQGVIALKTLYGSHPIYREGQEPDEAEITERLTAFYDPFHKRLETEVKNTAGKHGYALIFDAHSCPSIGPPCDIDAGQERPDIIFSNADGESVNQNLMNELTKLARQHGFTNTKINHPYTGGFITRQYGTNGEKGKQYGTEALQVEFNRKTMGIDERTMKIIDTAKFKSVQTFTNAMLLHLSAYASNQTVQTIDA
ncbi:MAG: N-formylglutamate amidohydrolase [Alphaproteobacteria bacterium]